MTRNGRESRQSGFGFGSVGGAFVILAVSTKEWVSTRWERSTVCIIILRKRRSLLFFFVIAVGCGFLLQV